MASIPNLIQGAAVVYVAPFGEAEPADTAIGSPPGGGWTDVGFTDDDATLNYTHTVSDIEVAQMLDIPEARITGRDFRITVSLMEAALANLDTVMHDLTAATGAGFASRTPGVSPFPTYVAVMLDGYAPGVNKRRRVIGRKCVNLANTSLNYQKGSPSMLAADWRCYAVTADNSIEPFKIIDAT